MVSAATSSILLLVTVGCFRFGQANFLRSAPPAGDHASASHTETDLQQLRKALVDEIQASIGDSRHATLSKLQAHEDALRPMFSALPKNDHGLLGHAVVRYAMHRYFAQRHGWSVKGLDPQGGHWNSSSPSNILLDRVPSLVQELFETRLNGKGLGLHDLAALTATMEHIVHDDAISRLEAAYRMLELSPNSTTLSETSAMEAVEVFMMTFVLGQDIKNLSAIELQAERASIFQTYPTWNDTLGFVHNIYKNVTGKETPKEELTMKFDEASHVVEVLQDQYGPWQDQECRGMKNALVKMEEDDNGRVTIKEFYGRRNGGDWQFSESIEYLRELGALDETNAQNPKVVIPNYMNSMSNCLANSGFYSVCCINECEGILGRIEQHFAAPTASPEEMMAFMEGVSSATVAAPRMISAALRRRLSEIAEHNDGRIPLHGRLFSQWLHHAFPRECPFPHEAGKTNPMTPEEWMAESGQSPVADASKAAIEVSKTTQVSAVAEEIPWVSVEELVHKPPPPKSAGSFRILMRSIVALVSFAAMIRGLLQTLPRKMLRSSKTEDCFLLPMAGKMHSA